MLQKLIIRNYAIIEDLTIEPDRKLNIVTGETGAGKSIMLGALSLILGERADTSVLIRKEEKCMVEAHFDVGENTAFLTALREEELDEDVLCIIRREISSSGKSRAFVNDTPVNLGTLNRLTSLLVDLHQQFDNLEIRDDHFQMDVLDAVAQSGILRNEYDRLFLQYRKLKQSVEAYKDRQSASRKEAEYKHYLLDELTQADLKEQEIEEAERQLKQFTHAAHILQVLESSRALLEEGDHPLVQELKRISQQMQSIGELLPGAVTIQQRMSSVFEELKDIAGELEILRDKVSLDPEAMQYLQERVDLGYKLMKKHAVRSTDELLALRRQLEDELGGALDLEETIIRSEKELAALYDQLRSTAAGLGKQRRKAAPLLAEKVTGLLALTGMPNARFAIELGELETPAGTGMDEVRFVLDANKSGQFLPIHKAASGGEMSRIMLAIKSLTAKAMQLPVLIFDEVDTGISGEAARQVGNLLRELGNYHQVICITHQPQVAAKGTRHFYVYKESGGAREIRTMVRILEDEERVVAIAKMIGGERPSEAAIMNARELVSL